MFLIICNIFPYRDKPERYTAITQHDIRVINLKCIRPFSFTPKKTQAIDRVIMLKKPAKFWGNVMESLSATICTWQVEGKWVRS